MLSAVSEFNRAAKDSKRLKDNKTIFSFVFRLLPVECWHKQDNYFAVPGYIRHIMYNLSSAGWFRPVGFGLLTVRQPALICNEAPIELQIKIVDHNQAKCYALRPYQNVPVTVCV